MKILYIHHGSVIGGAPTSLRNLIKGVKDNTDKIQLTVSCVYSSMIPFFLELNGVDVEKFVEVDTFSGRIFMGWSKLTLPSFFLIIKKIIKEPVSIYRQIQYFKLNLPDLIHLNSSILWSTGIAAKLCGIPVVWHIREASDDSKYNIIRIMYAFFIRQVANVVVCIGPQEYHKLRGKVSNKVKLIYNSLDDSYFSNNNYNQTKIRKELGFFYNNYTYLSLGGNSPRKGTYQIIRSIDYLDESYSCVIVGVAPKKTDKKISQTIINQLKKEDLELLKGKIKALLCHYDERIDLVLREKNRTNLFFSGKSNDVKPYIKACDVLVFAGTTPHSARPVYEAWALKKPVIVFDSEVMRMDVEDGVDGIIVKKHTAEALSEALIYLKSHPELSKQMGENGYKKTVERFSLKNNTEKILSVYREILGEDSI